MQLLLQILHLRVHLVALGFKTPEVVLLLNEAHFHLRDLLQVVRLEACLLFRGDKRLRTLEDKTVFNHAALPIFG